MRLTFANNHDHPLRTSISQILEIQSRPEVADSAITDNEQYVFARDKTFAMAQLIQGLLEETPASLTSLHALNQMQSHVQNALSELNSFIANKNPGHFVNAAAQFEQNILPLLWGFAPKLQDLPQPALPQLLSSQTEMAAQSIQLLKEQRDNLLTKISVAEETAVALNLRLTEMTESAAKERAVASASVASLQQTFTEKEIERTEAFSKSVKSSQEQLDAVIKELQDKSAGTIVALNTHRDDAARIVRVVGNIGVTGNYQQIADAESTQANFWRWVTVSIFCVGIGVAISTFVKYWDVPTFTPETLGSIAIRLLYALAITAPAWYTARESARHRTNSDRARQTELELASIGPFIELMPDDKKFEIREHLTKQYFGRQVDAHEIETPVNLSAMKDFVVDVVKAAKKS